MVEGMVMPNPSLSLIVSLNGAMRVDDAFHGITTLARVTTPEESAQAAGFWSNSSMA